MKRPLLFVFLFYGFFFFPLPSALHAADLETALLKAQVASLTSLVEQLSARIEHLEKIQNTPITSSIVSTPVIRPLAKSAPAYQNMNPDISVAGVAKGKLSDDRRDPDRNTIGLDESEVVFSKNISPYSRGNLTLGFHGDHAETEEGYVDFTHLLPGKMEARVGKFLVPVGFLNTIHSHDWPMVAKPLPLEYFTGEEGFSENGISFNTPIDLKSKTYMKASFDLLKGENALLFNNGQTRVLGSRVMTNTPLNDRDDLNFGVNFHQGAWNPRGDLDSKLYGVDLMLRRRFSQFDRLVLWGEWMWSRREQLAFSDVTANGYYVNLLYKFKKDRNWHVGLEYDCSEKPGDVRFNTLSKSAYIGYWLTENDRLQLQFRNKRDPFSQATNNELLFEVIWGMGPHKPHLANF